MRTAHTLTSLALLAAAAAIPAITAGAPTPVAAASTAARPMASAEVMAVYLKEKRVLLKHGPIANLGMSEMTMEFGLANRKMLASLKKGDRVKFSAALVAGDYVITHIEVLK